MKEQIIYDELEELRDLITEDKEGTKINNDEILVKLEKTLSDLEQIIEDKLNGLDDSLCFIKLAIFAI